MGHPERLRACPRDDTAPAAEDAPVLGLIGLPVLVGMLSPVPSGVRAVLRGNAASGGHDSPGPRHDIRTLPQSW